MHRQHGDMAAVTAVAAVAGPRPLARRAVAATAVAMPQPEPRRVLISAPETYKDRVRAYFAGRAATYDAKGAFHATTAAAVVDRGGLQPGDAVLDIATGTGLVALEAAGVVGEAGWVCGIDISEEMLAEVRSEPRPAARDPRLIL